MPIKTEIAHGRFFHLEELLTLFTALFLNLLIIIFSKITAAPVNFSINAGIVILIIAAGYLNRYYPYNGLYASRDWYLLTILIVIYMENKYLIPLINPHDVDKYLIQIDRIIFGGNDPAMILQKFTFPPVTEIMQIAYASFYFLPLSLCGLLYAKKIRHGFHTTASVILLGFYLSFAGYYLTPAIGPRFTLEYLQSSPLKGVLIYDFLQNTITALEGVTRDCCPSGHALISLLTLMLAYRFYRPFFPAASVWSVLQIASAVYLRYHYVTDIVLSLIILLPVYICGIKLSEFYYRGELSITPTE